MSQRTLHRYSVCMWGILIHHSLTNPSHYPSSLFKSDSIFFYFSEPINGGFGPWSNWSSCSQDCKPGSIKLRTRMCDDPKPLYGGLDCAGEKTEYRNCSVNECRGTYGPQLSRMLVLSFLIFGLNISVDGGLSDWTTWSECSQSCGDTAIRSRERTCTNPLPSEGGRNCSGETFQVKFCEKKSCHQGKCLFRITS